MIFISYYTGDSYRICSNRLRPSLIRFGFPYYIKEIKDTGNYNHNISFKPEFTKECLLKFKQPICWLDVDCEVIQYPQLLMDKNSEYINFKIYNWYSDDDNHVTRKYNGFISELINILPKKKSKEKLLSSSGVFTFNYSKESLNLLDNWISEMKKNINRPDDQVLDQVFNDGNYINKLKCQWLPKSYNRMSWYPDWLNVQPIINHTKSNFCNKNI